MSLQESQLEQAFVAKLSDLKYEVRGDIHDRASLEKNFRAKFQSLNRVQLTDGEFQRLLDEIVTPDVFAAAQRLREINAFTRDDGTPLINGIPALQIEFKTLGINHRRGIEHI